MMTHPKRTARTALLATAAAFIALGLPSLSWATSTATGSATAVVLIPIAVSKTTDLVFGDVVAGNGVVTVSTSGGRTKTGGVALPLGGSTATAARFDVTGDSANTFSIDYTGSTSVLSDGTPADDMNVAWIAEVVAATATGATTPAQPTTGTLTSGAAVIFVGGALTVGAPQTAGTYTGTIEVTLDYN